MESPSNSTRMEEESDLWVAIKSIRLRYRMTSRDFGRKYLNCPHNSVSQYEHGRMRPSTDRLIALLRIAATDEEVRPIIRALEGRGVEVTDFAFLPTRFPNMGVGE